MKKNILSLLLLIVVQPSAHAVFGGWSITRDLYKTIRSILPTGKIILELGSGWGTGQLVPHYIVYSVEHDPVWVNKYPGSTYIYAPIADDDWYDVAILKEKLPAAYDLLLVDGPHKRAGLYKHLDLFNLDNIPIVFDDLNNIDEYYLCLEVAQKLNRKIIMVGREYSDDYLPVNTLPKFCGVLMPNKG